MNRFLCLNYLRSCIKAKVIKIFIQILALIFQTEFLVIFKIITMAIILNYTLEIGLLSHFMIHLQLAMNGNLILIIFFNYYFIHYIVHYIIHYIIHYYYFIHINYLKIYFYFYFIHKNYLKINFCFYLVKFL